MRRLPLLLGLVLALSCAWVAPALAGSSDDEAIAEDSVLTESDVADYGLTEEEPNEDPPPSGAVCRQIRNVINAADELPHAVTAFSDNAGTDAESRVVVYSSAKAAKKPLKAYSNRKAPRCIESQIESDLQENLEPGSSYEFNLEPSSVPLGDEALVYQGVISITEPDGAVTDLYVEFGLIRVGRGLAVLDFSGVGSPFPGSEDLATIVADNLESNL
jgi:hypothetical protein